MLLNTGHVSVEQHSGECDLPSCAAGVKVHAQVLVFLCLYLLYFNDCP